MPSQYTTEASLEKGAQNSEPNDPRGIFLANPAQGEEVVITGMAGRFPASDDVYEYRNNLMNKKDLTSSDNRRWDPIYPEVPHRTGKIGCIEKFDAGYFGIHYRQAQQMDPSSRQTLERAVEAIIDAGYHPEELRGTNTGVFIGNCFSETEKTWLYDNLESPTFAITGCTRSMQAQWISYCLGLEGPSHIIDTACSSSLYALEHAYRAIRMGRCDSAIVGGTNLCMQPAVSVQLARLGVLSVDGSCKSFDADVNGYVRSEAVAVILLQKSRDARRIYAQIVHAKTNNDGFTEEGITFPSYQMQIQLMREIYQECKVDPTSIDFLEAHATGTKAGDTEELMAIDEVVCTNRKTPLLVGSVKSNIGHTEPSSGLCSLIKMLIGMENNCLIPNINYKTPREGAEALEKGRIVVLTELIPWPKDGSGLAGVNSFGVGGSNCHVLLKRCTKRKINGGLPKDNLPRLVCVSGRTEEAIQFIFDDISNRSLDEEYIRLFHESFKNDIRGHQFRGFIVMSKSGELNRSFKYFEGVKQPLCLICGGSNENWWNVSKELANIPLFSTTIEELENILSSKPIKLADIISKGASKNAFEIVIANVATQIALVNILKTLEVSPDYIIGCGSGELVAGYADGVLTLEQAVMGAYYYATIMQNIAKNNHTSYRAQIANKPYHGIVNDQLEDIQSDYRLTSDDLQQIHPELLRRLKSVIPISKQSSSKWLISTSESNLSRIPFSAEHLVNKLLYPPLLNQSLTKLPSKSIMLVVGSVVLKRHSNNSVNLVSEHQANSLFIGLGSLYNLGYNPKLQKLYPEIQWPVSASTSMISPLIKWNHFANWFVPLFKPQKQIKSGERYLLFSINDSEWAYMAGYVIDGNNLIPAAGYLVMVWDTLSLMMEVVKSNLPVIFENVKFLRPHILANQANSLFIMVQRESGKFEVRESGQVVVTGRIYTPINISTEIFDIPLRTDKTDSLALTTKDIYKELNLRGYNYTGLFRGLKNSNQTASEGSAEWNNNWVTFMDNMFQIQLLQEDSRKLYLPTSIGRLTIDPLFHMQYVRTFSENPVLPVYAYKELSLIKSGGIEIRGLFVNAISKRKPLNDPILETYKFIPFETELSIEQSIRICTELFSENYHGTKMRIVEVMDDATKLNPLGPIIHQAFSQLPLIQSEMVILSKNPLDLANITVEDRKLTSENKSCSMVIVSNILTRLEMKQQAINALKENGVILSREDLTLDTSTVEGFDVLAVHQTDHEKLILLRRPVEVNASTTVINISSDLNLDWLTVLKTALNNNENVLILAQNNQLNGTLGLVNCLKLEPGGLNIKCVLILDNKAPKFNLNNKFYSNQLKKGLAINIYKNGKWGTYRHLLLEKEILVQREHIFSKVTVRGDLSSLRWIEGPLTSKTILAPEKELVHIYYASLNFRDVMTVSGRINTDDIARNRLEQFNVGGFEFSGRNSSGRRVMGMVTSGALANMVAADTHLTWDIPDNLSLEEAATIPVAYCTVLLALVLATEIKPGQSILIHAGAGGVGQAAINFTLYQKCRIFTTVGTQEKRDFIRKRFPEIPADHIGNSRDTSFEQMILKQTNGRGVDVVLNSLSEEKLQASLRCLAPYGKFLEIGKFDMTNNNPIGLKVLRQGRTFYGITLDAFYDAPPSKKKLISDLLTKGLAKGMIKSITKTIFNDDQVEQAFQYTAEGKHIGEVTIKFREEERGEDMIQEVKLFAGIPRFYGNPDGCYIIYGGLGGFGLELADWIVTRGVRNLVLVSRSGVRNGYQVSKLRIWKSYGVNVKISSENITTKEGCVSIINDASRLGPIEGIFNLAVVLKDALMENQNEESFLASLAPKATATRHLDMVSRELCPELRYFVVFSSVTSGRGNAGQTNYGMANSIMERICEQRKMDGFPALAIQWGAIGDVGVLTETQELQTELEIRGCVQQRIISCLEVIDTIMKQDEPIVSSMVLAEKKSNVVGAGSMLDKIKNILGLQHLKTVSHYSPLSELGMDSMMTIEIKHTLKREYELFLTPQDIRSMTFARLLEVADEKATENATQQNKRKEIENLRRVVYLLLGYLSGEENSTVPIIEMPSLAKAKAVAPKVFLLPGIEGIAPVMAALATNLSSHTICLQYPYCNQPETTVEELAKTLLPGIKENLPKNTPFNLVAYSYGTIVALELAALLEAEGYIGSIILIDSVAEMFKKLMNQHIPDIESESVLETNILCALMELYIPVKTVMGHKNDIYNCKSFEERVNMVIKLAPEDTPYSESYRRQICLMAYLRIKSILIYKPKFPKLRSSIKVFKPSQPTLTDFDEDYRIQEYCEYPVEVNIFEGNHLTIIKNPEIAYAINTIIDTSSNIQYFEQSSKNKLIENGFSLVEKSSERIA